MQSMFNGALAPRPSDIDNIEAILSKNHAGTTVVSTDRRDFRRQTGDGELFEGQRHIVFVWEECLLLHVQKSVSPETIFSENPYFSSFAAGVDNIADQTFDIRDWGGRALS
jgi:hypothetical protein